jgi:hypothetical protein
LRKWRDFCAKLMLSEEMAPFFSRRTAPRKGREQCLASSAQALAPLGTMQDARSQAEFSSWRGEA